jgi:putative RecB family exonuclease
MERFSHSRISSFEKCPKAYEYQYLLKEPETFSTIEQHLGTSVHQALEWAYRQRELSMPTSLSVQKKFRGYFSSKKGGDVRVIKKGILESAYQEAGLEMIERFCSNKFENDRSETVGLEVEFVVKLAGGIQYRGFIDRISREKGGTLRITDYKTGSLVNEPSEGRQLPSYALWGFEGQNDDSLEICFEDLKKGKTFKSVVKRSDVPKIQNGIVKSIGVISCSKTFPASPSHLCRWCGYCPICPSAHASVPRKWRLSQKSNQELNEPEICPSCGGDLEERDGKYGSFVGCECYPDCKYTRNEW